MISQQEQYPGHPLCYHQNGDFNARFDFIEECIKYIEVI